MITSEQVKAARGLLRWNQQDLAAASGISLPAISKLLGPLAGGSIPVEELNAANDD